MKNRVNYNYSWWQRVSTYAVLLLAGQTIATLLGRLYYDKGGNSKWLATLIQLVGFPLLLPCYYYMNPKLSTVNATTNKTSFGMVSLSSCLIYGILGLLLAGDSVLFSLGLLYLPVSTFSLISASQLAFNALFSFFLNSQNFTPFIINSLVLLTVSSALLVQSLVATCAILVGLFASGEWKTLRIEMDEFELGKVQYLLILLSTMVSWQGFSIGSMGLILEVSSLFSNVISTLGLPLVPVLAVVFFHDEMNAIKLISMVLAIWGFVSYAYQHYLDDQKPEADEQTDITRASST